MQYTSTNHLYLKHISCFLPPASCFASLEAYLLPPSSFVLPRKTKTMRHDKLERQLDLMLLLAGSRGMRVEDICERLDISRRNFYYYMEFFRDCGFIVNKTSGRYSIDRESPFFKRLIERVSFTEAELIILRRLVDKVDGQNAVVEKLREKLGSAMDYQILNASTTNDQQAFIISQLHEAIKYKQMAVLKGYSSPHGHTQRDRLVEPFLLMNGNNEVRCYEPASGMNKTFKIARIQQVELLSENWQHEADHRKMFTDLFMFSGEERLPIQLRMGTLAHNLMLEEYPLSSNHFTQEDDKHWLLTLDVCSYAGIGRFVLGLFEDIEVLGSPEFIKYLQEKIKGYQIK